MKRIILALIFMLSISLPAEAVLVEWAIASGGNGHWYDVVHYRSTWDEANSQVQSHGDGRHLATLTSAEENAFVWSNFSHAGYWLGGYQINSDDEPDGNWAWVTGEEWNYTNWLFGEPNNNLSTTIPPSDENRLQFNWWQSTNVIGDWNDLSILVPSGSVEGAGSDGGYIIEYNTNPNAPVPEPATILLFSTGLIGAFIRRRRRR